MERKVFIKSFSLFGPIYKVKSKLRWFSYFPPFYAYLYSQEFSLYSFNPNIGCHPYKTLKPGVESGGHPEAQVIAHSPWRRGALMEGSFWFSFACGQWWYGPFTGESFIFSLHLQSYWWAVVMASVLQVIVWKVLAVGF